MHYYIVHQTFGAASSSEEQINFSTALSASVQGSAILRTGDLLTSIRGLNQERGRLGLVILKNVTC